MIAFTGNNILFVIIVFNLLFVSAITLFSKVGKKHANQFFAFFLLAKVLCFTTDFFYSNYDFAITRFVHVFFMGPSFDLLLGPLMLFYVRSLTFRVFKLRAQDLFHVLPFLIHVVYLTVVYYSKSVDDKLALHYTGAIYTETFRLINEVLIYCSFVFYAGYIVFELMSYHRAIKNTYADFNKYQMNWLIILIISLCSVWLLGIFSGVLSFFNIYLQIPLYVYLLSIFLFANVIFFYGIRYSSAFAGIDVSTTPKYKKNAIPDSQTNALLDRLIKHIETSKPYLEPDISIDKLAEQLSVPSYKISQVLNSRLNKNFFEFISYYRIKESMAQLSDAENKSKTILEILYEVGFNSKSAFNNAFKKHTGVTPSQYKKKSQSASMAFLQN